MLAHEIFYTLAVFSWITGTVLGLFDILGDRSPARRGLPCLGIGTAFWVLGAIIQTLVVA